jgi:hypothetical protein
MYKELRSLGYSLLIILMYYYSARGFIQLMWNDDSNNKVSARARFICYILFIFSFTFIIAIYHIVGPYHTAAFYKLFLIFHIIYLVLGNIFYIFTQK